MASDDEDYSASSQTPMITLQTEYGVQTSNPDDDNDDEDMLAALQSRRTMRLAELKDNVNMSENSSPGKTPKGKEKAVKAKDSKPEIVIEAPSKNEEGGTPPRVLSALESNSNLNISIRERLRSRVKSSSSDIVSSRKLRGLRERVLPTRFEDSSQFSFGRDELDPHLQESIATTKVWKKLKLKKEREAGLITDEEAFQFFVGSLDDGETKEDDYIEEELSQEGVLNIEIEESILINNVKPAYVSNKERQLIEDVYYHYPSTTPAPRESKVSKGTVPRNLEEEGFFIGVPPEVSSATLSKMENRILASDKHSAHTWFDEDGNLKRLPNPLKDQMVRQVLHNDDEPLDPLLQLDWQKAQISSLDARYIDVHEMPNIRVFCDGLKANLSGNVHYQLDVDISMLKFTHHPLFSKEHVLEARLLELCNHFQLRVKSGLKEHVATKLQALRASLKQLNEETEIIEERGSQLMSGEHAKRRKEFHNEIRELRLSQENDEIRERSLIMNILQTWQMLKKIRELQGFINTPTTMKVRKELTNKADDEERLQIEITEKLEEERARFEDSHAEEAVEYEKNLLKWKKYMRKKKKLAHNSVREGRKKNTLVEVEKPVRPVIFDEGTAINELRQKILQLRRKPGEPNLIPELQHGAVITPTEQCSRNEQLRRSAMKSAKYLIKVMFNDIEVSRTTSRGISTDFQVQFGEILSIKILQWPESIKLQIYNSSSNHLLAELFAPIPEVTIVASPDASTLEPLEFSSEQIVGFRHDGVGSGMNVDFGLGNDPGEGNNTFIPLTSGVLFNTTSWGVDERGVSLAPYLQTEVVGGIMNTAKHYDAMTALGAAGMIDMQKLLSWIANSKLDPNDPSNADIIHLAKMAQMSQRNDLSGPKYFRLNQLEKETEFATKEEIDKNKRFRLIKLRDTGVPELKNFQMIPAEENFVSDDVFEDYEKRLELEEEDPDEEYSQRKAVARFLAKVRQQVHSRSQLVRQQYDLEDLVVEEAIPDIGTLGTRLVQIFEPRRPLKPVRKVRKSICGQNLVAVKDVNILINIIRAFDIPVRNDVTKNQLRNVDSGTSTNSMYDQRGGYNAATTEIQSMVCPFIEVLFQGNFLRTTVGEGAFPNWNEDLILPFKPPNNDYTTESLQMVKDKIYINLFDEITIDMLTDDRLRETNVHQRIEKRWLGSIEIPFSTVYFNSKVEGFLPVNSPSVLLGYQRFAEKTNLNLIKEKTFVQLFVTIDPRLQSAHQMPEKFETNEDDQLVHNAQVWLSALRAKFPKRAYKVMVSDLDGKKVFVTRYIRAQKPPDELILDNEIPEAQKMKLLARYVSLIPYISDSVQFPDLCDIWTTSDQFLRMMAGDEEEHAILLCNYFLWFGKNAFVALGNGIPEGETAYVITNEGLSFRFWNASTGESYEAQDVHSPLQSVGCLINHENVYGNIQKAEETSKMNFNVINAKDWKPFFSKSFQNPGLASVQVDNLVYMPIDTQYAVNLQDQLERVLRDKLMEWRPRHITKFNRYCTQAFKNLLETIESKVVMSAMSSEEHRQQLQQVLSSHQLTGFPLHMAYTDTAAVVERVYSTGVHNTEDADIEFALAVHIHPYPNNILAVWVYIARLLRKTSG